MDCCSSSNALVPVPAEAGATERKIVFTKSCSSGLGLQAKPNSEGEAVVFEIFDGGMIQIWNHRNPGSKVTKGDRILSVNDVSSFWPMMFELQSKGTHTIVVGEGSLDDFVPMSTASEQKKDTAVAEEVVKSLPSVSPADCADKECSICLEELNGLEANVKLPCGHFFHRICAENWLTKRRSSCPLCTAPVTSDSVSSSQCSTDVGSCCEASPASEVASP